MNRNWDIFRNAANGIDPSQGTRRFNETRRRSEEKMTARERDERSDYVLETNLNDRRAEWSHDREQDDYGSGARARMEGLHGGADERLHGGEGRGWVPSYGDEGFGRTSQGWGGYTGYARDDRRLAHLYDNEHDYRFDRHGGARFEEEKDHPSLWQRVKGAFTGKGPKNWARSDERIREDVCERLCDHPHIDASDIEVVVKEGEVTLVGLVDHRRTKRLAEDVTEEVRGVRDIHNQIRVKT